MIISQESAPLADQDPRRPQGTTIAVNAPDNILYLLVAGVMEQFLAFPSFNVKSLLMGG